MLPPPEGDPRPNWLFIMPERKPGAYLRVSNSRPKFDIATSYIPAAGFTSQARGFTDYRPYFEWNKLVQIWTVGSWELKWRKLAFSEKTISIIVPNATITTTVTPIFIAAHNDMLFYSDGLHVYKKTLSGTNWINDTLVAGTTGATICALGCSDNTMVVAYSTGDVAMDIFDALTATKRYTWQGRLNRTITGAKLFVTDDYVYFDSDGDEAPVFFGIGNPNTIAHSGVVAPIIPIDSRDETQKFNLLGAYWGYSTNVVTGEITRKNGTRTLVYLIGSHEFTFGQDYVAALVKSTPGNIDNAGVKLSTVWAQTDHNYATPHIIGVTTFWIISPNYALVATLPEYIGGTYPATPHVDASNIQVNMSSGTPNMLTATVNANLFNTINAGDDINLQMTADPAAEVISQFVIDSVKGAYLENGRGLQISGSSPNMRKLAMWEADNYYDLWSQTKVYGDTKDLTKMVRKTGLWVEAESALTLESLNQHGVLYMTERSSYGCSMRARFKAKPITGYFGEYGLMLNYKKETIADATKRLDNGKTATDDDCNATGFIVSYSANGKYGPAASPTNGSAVSVYSYNVSGGVTYKTYIFGWTAYLPVNSWYWLMAEWVNGYLQVSAAADTLYWQTFTGIPLYLPYGSAFDADAGRAGIYMNNATVSGETYAFSNESKVIPVSIYAQFPASETLLVDNEQITYTGKSNYVAGDEVWVTQGLYTGFSNGQASSVNIGYDVSSTVVRQPFTNSYYDKVTNQLDVYVQKIGNPADGLEISVVSGTDLDPLNARKVSAVIPAKEISNTAGWVKIRFSSNIKIAAGDAIQVRKSGGGSALIGTSDYYKIFGGTPSAGTKYHSTLKTWSSSGVGFSFAAYLFVIDPNVASIMAPQTGLNLTTDVYVGMALAVTQGAGKGQASKIVSYSVNSGYATFGLETNISGYVNETSKVKPVPCLTGLTRLNPASHSATTAHVYRAGPFTLVDKFGYFSQELDMRIEDVVSKIAKASGVTQFTCDRFLTGEIDPSSTMVSTQKRSLIAKITAWNETLAAMNGTVVLAFRAASASRTPASPRISFTSTGIQYIDSAGAVVSNFYWTYEMGKEITVSIFERFISIWSGYRPIHTFVLTDSDFASTGTWFCAYGTCSNTLINVNVSEGCLRIDNFVMDMGKTGLSLVQQIVSNKQFYFSDTSDGLRMFHLRKCINDADIPYVPIFYGSVSKVEPAYTRSYLEGGEVVEKIDEVNTYHFGNIFHRETISEINDVFDAEDYADLVLDEVGKGLEPITFTGALYPIVSPQDTMFIMMPDGTSKEIIVDTISYNINISGTGNEYNMNVTGRQL